MSSRASRRRMIASAPVYVALGAWAAVCLFPLYWIAVTSLKGEYQIVKGPFYLPFVDFTPTLDSWRFILWDASENLLLQFFNSAVVGISSTALTLLLAGMFVYGITRLPFAVTLTSAVALGLLAVSVGGVSLGLFWLAGLAAAGFVLLLVAGRRIGRRGPTLGKRALLFGLLATRILPPVIVVLPIYLMALHTGTLDTRFALIVTYTASNLPIALWLLVPVFGDVATEQEEAAQLDGASRLRVFATVLVPMLAAGITAAGVLVFVLCWNEYLFAAYLAAGRAMTMPPWVVGQLSMKEGQIGGDIVEWSRLSAAMVVMTVPVVVAAAFVQRFLRRFGIWRRA
ncbi:MAG: carbohydrate ABC transporter permease [Bauldia sp.]